MCAKRLTSTHSYFGSCTKSLTPHTSFPYVKTNAYQPVITFQGLEMRIQNDYLPHKTFQMSKHLSRKSTYACWISNPVSRVSIVLKYLSWMSIRVYSTSHIRTQHFRMSNECLPPWHSSTGSWKAYTVRLPSSQSLSGCQNACTECPPTSHMLSGYQNTCFERPSSSNSFHRCRIQHFSHLHTVFLDVKQTSVTLT